MNLETLRQVWRVVLDAVGNFDDSEGWVMASHVAMTSLLALFPFLIFATAVASIVAEPDLAERAAILLLSTWPEEVAEPLAGELHTVLARPRQDLLTISLVIALWIASNGVESLRVALNRAYRVRETRSFVLRRAQSFLFVLIGAVCALVLSLFIVLLPAYWETIVSPFPEVEPFWDVALVGRYLGATLLLAGALIAAHRGLPARAPHFAMLWPGVLFTLVTWLLSATAFGIYLANFSSYIATYAGLASAATALVFLYLSAVIFILGGELNAAIARAIQPDPRIADQRDALSSG